METENAEDVRETGEEDVPFSSGLPGPGMADIKTAGSKVPAVIPERVVKKLAKTAGLEYRDGDRSGGGGLCTEIEGLKRRRRALMVLGILVSRVGDGSTDTVLEEGGATWLDVVGWKDESPEYVKLWQAAMKIREHALACRLLDRLWDRAYNGYDVEEARSTRDGVEKVVVRKYDTGLAMQLLKGFGYVASTRAGRTVAVGGAAAAPEPVGEEGAAAEPDTVLFHDRKTAFEVMGNRQPVAAAKTGV